MINNFVKWFENLWNLRNIFDKYIPKIKEIGETIRILRAKLKEDAEAIKLLHQQLRELKAFKEELEGPSTAKTQALELEESKD